MGDTKKIDLLRLESVHGVEVARPKADTDEALSSRREWEIVRVAFFSRV